jgi:hypothetical protein
VDAFPAPRVRVEEMIDMGLAQKIAFDSDYSLRVKQLGLNGKTAQEAFTVACAMSHRRIWQLVSSRQIPVALVLESDQQFDRPGWAPPAVSAVIRAANEADPSWELINLGRCYDYCEADVVVGAVRFARGEALGKLVRSLSPLCTHSYLVSLAGARKLLSVTLPHTTAVDSLMALLGRIGLMRVYSVTPRLFTQDRGEAGGTHRGVKLAVAAHLKEDLPECDPDLAKIAPQLLPGPWTTDLAELSARVRRSAAAPPPPPPADEPSDPPQLTPFPSAYALSRPKPHAGSRGRPDDALAPGDALGQLVDAVRAVLSCDVPGACGAAHGAARSNLGKQVR